MCQGSCVSFSQVWAALGATGAMGPACCPLVVSSLDKSHWLNGQSKSCLQGVTQEVLTSRTLSLTQASPTLQRSTEGERRADMSVW